MENSDNAFCAEYMHKYFLMIQGLINCGLFTSCQLLIYLSCPIYSALHKYGPVTFFDDNFLCTEFS